MVCFCEYSSEGLAKHKSQILKNLHVLESKQ